MNKLPNGIYTDKPLDDIKYNQNIKLEDVEKEYIYKAMLYHNNRKRACAKALGIAYQTLYKKLKKYGLYEKFKLKNGPAGPVRKKKLKFLDK